MYYGRVVKKITCKKYKVKYNDKIDIMERLMFPAQKLKLATEQFDKDMKEAKPSVIKQDLQEIQKYSNHAPQTL